MLTANFPIISIDVGTKRVGIAVIMVAGSKANYKTIVGREAKKAEKLILKLISEKKIRLLVAGMPLDANNKKTSQCEDVENFCGRITKRCEIEVVYVDEFLSSEEAHLKSGRAKAVDDLAAEIILQRYLQSVPQ